MRVLQTLNAFGVSSRFNNCTTWPCDRPHWRSTALKGGRSSQATSIARAICSVVSGGTVLAMVCGSVVDAAARTAACGDHVAVDGPALGRAQEGHHMGYLGGVDEVVDRVTRRHLGF